MLPGLDESIDIDVLTRPIAPDEPCGENLEYHADFLALESAARGKPEQQSGDRAGNPIVIPAEPPAWDLVRQRSLDLFERTRDLRVAVLLVRALTRTEGLHGLAGGLSVVAALIDSLWGQIHPRPDPDDDDPMVRVNVLAALVDPAALIGDLRASVFVSDPRLGRCTIRQLESSLGLAESSGDDDVPRAQIESLLRIAAANGRDNDAAAAIGHAQRIAALLAERAGAANALDFEPLLRRLRPIAAFYREAVPDAAAGPAEESSGTPARPAMETSGGSSQGAGAIPGEIQSREDVMRMLDKVCDFLERTEPTNPAPLLIRRAQRLMTMSFVDILRELAPEGVAAVSKVAGLGTESS